MNYTVDMRTVFQKMVLISEMYTGIHCTHYIMSKQCVLLHT